MTITAIIYLYMEDEEVTLTYETKPMMFRPKWMHPIQRGSVKFNEIVVCESYKERFVEQAKNGILIPMVTSKDCPPNKSLME